MKKGLMIVSALLLGGYAFAADFDGSTSIRALIEEAGIDTAVEAGPGPQQPGHPNQPGQPQQPNQPGHPGQPNQPGPNHPPAPPIVTARFERDCANFYFDANSSQASQRKVLESREFITECRRLDDGRMLVKRPCSEARFAPRTRPRTK